MLNWAEREGYGPLGLTGISMGGHMASISATNWPKPISLIPCLSWSTASCVFTQGVMSGSIPWELLKAQYFSGDFERDYFLRMIRRPEIYSDAFVFGRHFASNYPKSVVGLRRIQAEEAEAEKVEAEVVKQEQAEAVILKVTETLPGKKNLRDRIARILRRKKSRNP